MAVTCGWFYGRVRGSTLVAALWALLAASSALAQGTDFEDAKNAYLSGNYETALSLARPLATSGNSDAQVLLSLMYDNGQGVPQDKRKATMWLQRAADNGNNNAKHDLGLRYYRGQGIEQNYQAAAKWWQQAADAGVPDSQFNLALLYHRGLGVEQDFIKARKYFGLAADKGHDLAQYSLATMHAFGHGGVKDYKTAFQLFQKAANRGTAQAQYNLGVFYENGYGVTRDLGEAKRWYRLASAQNLQEATERLGALELSSGSQPVGIGAQPPKVAAELGAAKRSESTLRPGIVPPRSPNTASPPPTAATRQGGDLVRREDWIRSQPDKNFTLQVVSLRSEAEMLSFLSRYHWGREVAYAKVLVNGQIRYSGVYGSFSSRSQAQSAVAELPPEMQKNKPWARNFAAITKLLTP